MWFIKKFVFGGPSQAPTLIFSCHGDGSDARDRRDCWPRGCAICKRCRSKYYIRSMRVFRAVWYAMYLLGFSIRRRRKAWRAEQVEQLNGVLVKSGIRILRWEWGWCQVSDEPMVSIIIWCALAPRLVLQYIFPVLPTQATNWRQKLRYAAQLGQRQVIQWNKATSLDNRCQAADRQRLRRLMWHIYKSCCLRPLFSHVCIAIIFMKKQWILGFVEVRPRESFEFLWHKCTISNEKTALFVCRTVYAWRWNSRMSCSSLVASAMCCGVCFTSL